MSKNQHKEVKISSVITKLKGYSTDENYWSISESQRKDTFLSNVTAKSGNSKVKINVLFEGSPKEVPNELLDTYLCVGDSSYNPSRPFRWYRGDICVMTTTEEEIHVGRLESFELLLKEIDKPEEIFIYEIEIVE